MAITLKKTQTIPSASVPGISYEVRTVTHGLRFEIEAQLESFSGKARDLIAASATERKGKDVSSPEVAKAIADLNKLELIERAPLVLRQVLVAVHGVDGSVDEFLEFAPATLFEEAYEACKAAYGLTAEQQKNSESPSTLCNPVQGETNDSIA
jgi:hypothetical protein